MNLRSQLLDGIEAVVFDAVGTLLHPQPSAGDVYFEAGRRFGSRLSRDEIGRRFRRAFASEEALDRENGLTTDEARELTRWRDIVTKVLDDVMDSAGCFKFLYDHFAASRAWRLDEDAPQVLAAMTDRGLRLGIASNFDRRLRTVVAGFPELERINHLVVSSEVGWRKPAAGFFGAVRAAVGASDRQILFVGDDLANDYHGARAAGLRAVLLDPRNQAPAETNRIGRLTELLGSGPR